MEISIKDRLAEINERITRAAGRVGRPPEDVKLVAVTKTHPTDSIRELLALGQTALGENRAQEFVRKVDELGKDPPEWHFIGHLQRNKARQIVGRANLIHSVDSVRLITELNRRAEERELIQPVLLEINVSNDPHKTGASIGELDGLLEAVNEAPHLDCRGLMTIPRKTDDDEETRDAFRTLKSLLSRVGGSKEQKRLELSMGMSRDFEMAIEEGSTLIRVGSELMGPRLV